MGWDGVESYCVGVVESRMSIFSSSTVRFILVHGISNNRRSELWAAVACSSHVVLAHNKVDMKYYANGLLHVTHFKLASTFSPPPAGYRQ